MTKESDIAKIRNAAIIGTGINVFLSIIKFLAGSITASISLIADGINSLSDVFPSLAVAVGIKISERPPTEDFPYGFHKIENFVSLFISLAIFYGAYEMITAAIDRFVAIQVIENPIVGIITAIVSIITLFVISTYKIKIGKQTNSPSLLADGEHSRVDVFASLAVLIGVSGAFFGIYIMDAIAAIIAAIFVIRAGYETFKASTKVLLDASIPYDAREQIKEIALETSGVKKVQWIRARGSGKYFFAELKIEVDAHIDVEKAQLLVEKLKANIKNQVENIDNVLILLEPKKKELIRIAVPIEEDQGLKSPVFPRFGETAYFAIIDIRDDALSDMTILENPFRNEPKRKGILIAEWLGDQQKVDKVFIKEPLKKGPTYAFDSYYVQVTETKLDSLKDIIAEISKKKVP
ncbi:cation diffusion facilitator family transporter [Candidatus Borrarchaeum sp.]|uniref:cation diffusion facilitator family transporter n=1 Tax=Candidatus Borrarchaeum sp. TaxID=2846742 RepID=UPI00257EA1D7|nr:cation diffusion facilitator family transporter [Candidatus Borrarchaeum sp.]